MKELKLPESFKKNIEAFVESLKVIYRGELIAVILYGSAASGELTGSRSNVNLLVVLQKTDLPSLERSRNLINKRSSRGIEPLFLSREYVSSSSDVFPIEFLDMKENHVCLQGEDVLKEIKIDLKNLRFQCEQELKSKLLLVKQQYLRVNLKDKRALAEPLFRNFTSVTHILRNLVRLKGKIPLYAKEDLFREIAAEFQVGTTTLSKIWQAKKDPTRLAAAEFRILFTDFVLELDKIVNAVDTL